MLALRLHYVTINIVSSQLIQGKLILNPIIEYGKEIFISLTNQDTMP